MSCVCRLDLFILSKSRTTENLVSIDLKGANRYAPASLSFVLASYMSDMNYWFVYFLELFQQEVFKWCGRNSRK